MNDARAEQAEEQDIAKSGVANPSAGRSLRHYTPPSRAALPYRRAAHFTRIESNFERLITSQDYSDHGNEKLPPLALLGAPWAAKVGHSWVLLFWDGLRLMSSTNVGGAGTGKPTWTL